MSHKILLLPGDGIGPEVIAEAKRLLTWLQDRRGIAFETEEALVGGCAYDADGTPLSDATIARARAADAVILAVGGNGLIRTAMDAARPGGRVLLFAQTVHGEAVIDPAAICVEEKTLVGSYSASVDLQEQSIRFVMNREMDLGRLVSHRFRLIESGQVLDLAAHPQPSSMKIVIQPGGTWEPNAWEGSKQ